MFIENASILPSKDMGQSIEFWRAVGLMLMFSDADEPSEAKNATLGSGGFSVHLQLGDATSDANGQSIRVLISDKDALFGLFESVSALGAIKDQLAERTWTRMGFSFVSPEGAEIHCHIDK